jgi:hypothetical protein
MRRSQGRSARGARSGKCDLGHALERGADGRQRCRVCRARQQAARFAAKRNGGEQ